MRVGLVVPGGIDPSGRERVIPALLWLLERLARRHEVDAFVLFHSSSRKSYDLLGARVHDLGLRSAVPGLGFLRAARELTGAVAETGSFDVLHAFWAGTPGYAAGRAGRALRVPVVLSLGGGELVALREIGYGAGLSWRGRWPVRRSLRLASAITAASGPMCEAAKTHGARAERVPLGPDLALFAGPRPPEGPPWRLLHVADLNPVKDQATLLAAFARVRSGLRDVHLDLIGRDTMEGAAARLARDLGVADAVTFHGWLPTEDFVPFLHRAHLLVHASRHEAGPLVVLEAAAAGLPTVGTAVGHLLDLAPGAALAVPVGDAEALAQGILALLRDREARRTLGERARAWVEENDADATAARFSAIYESVALGGATRSRA